MTYVLKCQGNENPNLFYFWIQILEEKRTIVHDERSSFYDVCIEVSRKPEPQSVLFLDPKIAYYNITNDVQLYTGTVFFVSSFFYFWCCIVFPTHVQ